MRQKHVYGVPAVIGNRWSTCWEPSKVELGRCQGRVGNRWRLVSGTERAMARKPSSSQEDACLQSERTTGAVARKTSKHVCMHGCRSNVDKYWHACVKIRSHVSMLCMLCRRSAAA